MDHRRDTQSRVRLPVFAGGFFAGGFDGTALGTAANSQFLHMFVYTEKKHD